MTRPCFLVIDREFAGSISTRKLVIETAKFNVVTAYGGQEAIETLKRFPSLDGAVVDAGFDDMDCDLLVRELKKVKPSLPVIAICGPGSNACPSADYHLESFSPAPLLLLLRKLMPQVSEAIEKREEELHEEGRTP